MPFRSKTSNLKNKAYLRHYLLTSDQCRWQVSHIAGQKCYLLCRCSWDGRGRPNTLEKFSVGQRLGLDLAERDMSNVSLFANIKKHIQSVKMDFYQLFWNCIKHSNANALGHSLGVARGTALCALGGRDDDLWPSGERLLWALSITASLTELSTKATVGLLLANPKTHTHTQ